MIFASVFLVLLMSVPVSWPITIGVNDKSYVYGRTIFSLAT